MPDLKKFTKDTFKAAQSPTCWLLSAERLRDGAEAILVHEEPFEVPYFQAYEEAAHKATAIAYAEGNDSALVEIEARVPNYPAAQLLYAYALENLLKGIIIAQNPSIISEEKLSQNLVSHEIHELAERANLQINIQEVDVVDALSELAKWAGRYPVARVQKQYIGYASGGDRSGIFDVVRVAVASTLRRTSASGSPASSTGAVRRSASWDDRAAARARRRARPADRRR